MTRSETQSSGTCLVLALKGPLLSLVMYNVAPVMYNVCICISNVKGLMSLCNVVLVLVLKGPLVSLVMCNVNFST